MLSLTISNVRVCNFFSMDDTIERYRNHVKEVQTENSSSVEDAQVQIFLHNRHVFFPMHRVLGLSTLNP